MATKAGSILYQSFEDKKWTLVTVGTCTTSPVTIEADHSQQVQNRLRTDSEQTQNRLRDF